MSRQAIVSCLLACCMLLALSGCGNKGPLVLPEEEKEEIEKSESVNKGGNE